MMTILFGVLGFLMIILGVSAIQAGFGVGHDRNVIQKTWNFFRFILSSIWGAVKRNQDRILGSFVGVLLIATGVVTLLFVSWKQDSDAERATGTLGMSRFDWMLVSHEARKANGHRTQYERAWLGDSIEVQHSEMQRHVSDPESTLIRVYLPGPVDGSLYYEVSPKGETKEWKMPATPPIFPKK